MSLEDLANAVCEGDSDKARLLSEQMLNRGTPPKDLLEGLMHGLTTLGEMWDRKEAFLVEVLCAVETFNTAFEVIRPSLREGEAKNYGKVVIGTVSGDIHYVGKNMVKALWEGNGFEVIDLGEDVSATKFGDAVADMKPDILAMSCLVSTSLPEIEEVLRELKSRGLRSKVKVMVGGPPVTSEFAKKVGADLTALDAFKAVEVAKEAMRQG